MAALGIDETLAILLDCIAAELKKSDAPVCSISATVGSPTFALCCDCGNGEGELRGHLLRTYRADKNTLADTVPVKPCIPVTWGAQYEITLARCFPTIDERGNLPDTEDLTSAAAKLHADTAAIHRAIHCCADIEPAYLEQTSVVNDPEGGCSYLIATVRVPVAMSTAKNLR